MKMKVFALLLCLLMLLSTACGEVADTDSMTETETRADSEVETPEESDTEAATDTEKTETEAKTESETDAKTDEPEAPQIPALSDYSANSSRLKLKG